MRTEEQTVWTLDEIRKQPASVNVDIGAEMLGVGRTYAYQLIRENRFPVPTIRIGNRIVVPTAGILALLDPQSTVQEAA